MGILPEFSRTYGPNIEKEQYGKESGRFYEESSAKDILLLVRVAPVRQAARTGALSAPTPMPSGQKFFGYFFSKK
jgi:hypothetical protein